MGCCTQANQKAPPKVINTKPIQRPQNEMLEKKEDSIEEERRNTSPNRQSRLSSVKKSQNGEEVVEQAVGFGGGIGNRAGVVGGRVVT